MSAPTEPGRLLPRRSRRTAIDGAIALVAILLIVQIWLLTAALEAFLGGRVETALPAAVVSGALFAAVVALYLFIERLDREAQGRR